MQVIGLVISEVILLSAVTSKSNCNPENEGKNFGISQIGFRESSLTILPFGLPT